MWFTRDVARLRKSSDRQQRLSPRRIETGRCIVNRQIEDLLELDDVVDLSAHRDVGHAFEDELDHHRHTILLHQSARGRESRLRILWVSDTDRFAAETLADCDM